MGSKKIVLLPTAATIYADNAPFFESSIPFYGARGNYACILCNHDTLNRKTTDDAPVGVVVGKTTDSEGNEKPINHYQGSPVAITYSKVTGGSRFAHIACIGALPGMTEVITDAKARAKASKAAKKIREARRAAGATPPASIPTPPASIPTPPASIPTPPASIPVPTEPTEPTVDLDTFRAEVETAIRAEYDAPIATALDLVTKLTARVKELEALNASMKQTMVNDAKRSAQRRAALVSK